MMTIKTPCALEALLRRKDIWRGHSQAFVAQQSISTGFDNFDQALLHKGWPQGGLIELLQDNYAAIWFLLTPVLKSVIEHGLVAILNPPAEPYAVALQRNGIDTNKVFVVHTESKSDFIACFTELSKSNVFSMVMAWQSKQAFNYSELRKCHLACLNSSMLSFLFRHTFAVNHHSPAVLRILLSIQARCIDLECIKQRGAFKRAKTQLYLPDAWFAMHQYKELEQQGREPLYRKSNATPWAHPVSVTQKRG